MRNKILKRVITVIFLLLHTLEIFGANLVVDPNSTYNTKVDESRNGVPIVNISTPNDRGVSINQFKEYNVDEKGQILNNADNIGRSHLGGLINANPNLAPNQAANLIILQVNGSNRSQIEGYLEALSRQKVDVILANENGLYINNSGTINIKNFTATTGKLNLKDGDFVGIDVEKGNVLIGPKGFNGNNTDYVDIIAKTLELRGNIVANNLNIKTGSNDKNSSNTLAIDASELGGMYAGVIKIVSTDKGVGVNSDSFIVSKDKKLEITADGQIKINKVQGKGIDIKGKEYEQKDLTYSDGDISIKVDKIKLAGTGTQANKQINLNGIVENSATIYTKEGIKTKALTNTGVVQATNKIEVEGNLTNNGEILTNKNLTAKDTISTKKLIAKDGISVGKLENSGVVVTEKNLNVNKNLINSGNVQAVGKISVVENTNNTGEILTNSSFTSKNTITTKKLIAKEGISVANLESSGIIATDKKLDIKGNLINSGEIQTLDNIIVKDNILNTGDILTNGTLTSKDVKNEKASNVLISLTKIMEKVDISDFEKEPPKDNWLNKILGRAKDVFAKYDTIEKDINTVSVELLKYKQDIDKGQRDLVQMYKTVESYYKDITNYINAISLVENNLLEKKDDIEQSVNIEEQEKTKQLTQLQTLTDMVSTKKLDLITTQTVALQTLPMLEMMLNNDFNLSRKIQSSIITTLPVFKNAIVIAVNLRRQRVISRTMAEVDKATNELILKNAKNVSKNSVEIAKAANTAAIDVETLKQSFEIIKQGILDTKEIQIQARIDRDSSIKELENLNKEIRESKLIR